MHVRSHIRSTVRQLARIAAMLCLCCVCASMHAQQPQVLDRVVAVVNNHAILESDIRDELRLFVLDPERGGRRNLSARRALQLLISRALIQQQIGQGNMQAQEPTEEEVQARMKSLREQLPACVQANCASDAGWHQFLADNGLTEPEVASYLRLRMIVLSFIETRFRQGIQISPEQVEKYYRETLLPQYPKNETAPALDSIAPRIQEILLQQQVNVLFATWLNDLRKQGDVEVLDPALEPATSGQESEQ